MTDDELMAIWREFAMPDDVTIISAPARSFQEVRPENVIAALRKVAETAIREQQNSYGNRLPGPYGR